MSSNEPICEEFLAIATYVESRDPSLAQILRTPFSHWQAVWKTPEFMSVIFHIEQEMKQSNN